jgi:hypothetical protein
MIHIKPFNESFSKEDFYKKLDRWEYPQEEINWQSQLRGLDKRDIYTQEEKDWLKSNGWDNYHLRLPLYKNPHIDWSKLHQKRDKDENWVFNRDYYISVFKTPDEYFIVGFGSRSVYPCDNYYKCDQWEGFLELIKDISDRNVRL